MTQPLWKRWLSYVTEVHVESAPTEVNPHLYVSLQRGRYQLSTANAIYSYADLYTNFLEAFRQIEIQKRPIERVLLLGFGLGSIPYLLEREFGQRYQYTAVELDETVLALAQKYTLQDLESPIEMVCANAYAYVLQCQEQYDLVCMDIFLDDLIPEEFQSVEYLEALKGLIAPNGLLLYNCLSSTPTDQELTKLFFERDFLKCFPNGTYLDVSGNWILTNRKDV